MHFDIRFSYKKFKSRNFQKKMFFNYSVNLYFLLFVFLLCKKTLKTSKINKIFGLRTQTKLFRSFEKKKE